MCGYCFVFCCAFSFALRGTEKAGCLLRRGRRAGCEGGLKRVGFSSSRLLGTGLELLLLAGREVVSGRARSEVWGWRMARRVSWRDSWSTDIVDMVDEVEVCKMELSTMVVENHHHLSLGKNFPLNCGQTNVTSERRRQASKHTSCYISRPLNFLTCWKSLAQRQSSATLRKAFILFCLIYLYIKPEQLF
jgi:hypothetical protein